MIKKPLKVIFAILMCISMVSTFMPMSIYSWADDTVVSESSSEDVVQEVDSTEKGIEESVTETTTVEEDTSAQEGGDQASKDKEAPVAKTEVKTEEALSSNQPTEVVTKAKMKKAAVDDSTPNYDVQGSKKASPTTLGSDRKTTVTLEMPSGEYQNKIDIVFVMDNSTSTKNIGYDFSNEAKALFDDITAHNPGVELKVGVVKFRGYATDMLEDGLKLYSGNEDAIKAAIANTSVPGSGSNIHSGMVMAEKILSADTAVEDSHKYVILLTDGKSYIWNNDKDEPVMNYSQFLKSATVQSSGKAVCSQTSGNNNRECGPVYSTLPYDGESVLVYNNGTMGDSAKSSSYYQWLYDSNNEELSSVTKYDFPAYYSKYYTDYSGNGQPEGATATPPVITPINGTTVFPSKQFYRKYYDFTPKAGTVWEDLNFFTISPYKLTEDGDGNTIFDTNAKDPDFFLLHPDTLQKGTYTAGHYWKETIAAKYHTAVITPPATKVANGSGLHLAGSFSVWLRENCDNGAIAEEQAQVIDLFSNIDNSIQYMVGSGVVTDKITDEFELDTSAGGCPFKMTKDGESIAASSSGDNSWNFGTAIDGVYPYVVEYDESSKTIKWTINVPIENLKKITLSYGLILGEEYPSGTYDTNKSAVLEYTSTDGKYEGEYEFEKPKVTYEKEAPNYTLTINYLYAGGGTAARSYTSTLKAGASYGPINSPAISGYKPDRTSVSGTMPSNNVTINVVYSAIPNDDDDNPGGGNPGGGNPGGGGGNPGVVAAAPAAATTVPNTPTPTTNPPTTNIPDPEPPLAEGAWALVNLISAILTALGAIVALFRRKEEEDEEDEEQNRYNAEDEEEDDNRSKKMLAAKIAGALAGIAAPITFILTEDMSLPMIMIDKWTPLMLIMLAVQIVAAIANKKASELDDEEEEEEPETV